MKASDFFWQQLVCLRTQQIEGCSLKVQGCNPLVSTATIYIPCVYHALCVKSQEDIL